MPTKKKIKKRRESAPFKIQLTPRERTTLGRKILKIMDGQQCGEFLAALEVFLGATGAELLDVDNVLLNSDFLASLANLQKQGQRVVAAVDALEPEIQAVLPFATDIDFELISAAMDSIAQAYRQLKSQRSKRGGERQAFLKNSKAMLDIRLDAWLGKTMKAYGNPDITLMLKPFRAAVHGVMKRSIREIRLKNTGEK